MTFDRGTRSMHENVEHTAVKLGLELEAVRFAETAGFVHTIGTGKREDGEKRFHSALCALRLLHARQLAQVNETEASVQQARATLTRARENVGARTFGFFVRADAHAVNRTRCQDRFSVTPGRKLGGWRLELGIQRRADLARFGVHQSETCALGRQRTTLGIEHRTIAVGCRTHALRQREDQSACTRLRRVGQRL